MRGKLLILAGDFRQTLPIIPRSTPADEIGACLKSSYLWKHIQQLKLTINMRTKLQNNANAENFAKQLLDIGEGRLNSKINIHEITIPENFCNVVLTMKELIATIYPNIQQNYKNKEWLWERAILDPLNEDKT